MNLHIIILYCSLLKLYKSWGFIAIYKSYKHRLSIANMIFFHPLTHRNSTSSAIKQLLNTWDRLTNTPTETGLTCSLTPSTLFKRIIFLRQIFGYTPREQLNHHHHHHRRRRRLIDYYYYYFSRLYRLRHIITYLVYFSHKLVSVSICS